MDKNIIKKYLSNLNLSEALDGTPGIKLNKKIGTDNKNINKTGVGDIGKEMTSYGKGLTKTETGDKTMATNKFNYDTDKEKQYHDEVEIMNGQEMIQYDRTPSETFKERAIEAIEGSTRMGNNPEWANVVAKGQGGDPEFGKNLVKSIKASQKKRQEQTPTSKMFGDDWEITNDKSHKSIAVEGVKNKKTMKENEDYERASRGVEYGMNPYNEPEDMGIFDDGKLYDLVTNKRIIPNYCDGAGLEIDMEKGDNYITVRLCVNIFDERWDKAETETLDNPASSRELSSFDYEIMSGEIMTTDPRTGEDMQMPLDDRTKQMVQEQLHRHIQEILAKKIIADDSQREDDFDEDSYRDRLYNENSKGKKTMKDLEAKKQVKEGIKRLKFKKQFDGVKNALKLIPESYKVDNKIFEMTDGNEKYRIRWEGSLNEGNAIVLMASEKNLVNEDIQKMKHLFGYKSQDTLGVVRGSARIDENKQFTDIWDKMKKIIK